MQDVNNEESRPLEDRAGSGQPEETPMGFGRLGWIIVGVFVLLVLGIFGYLQLAAG